MQSEKPYPIEEVIAARERDRKVEAERRKDAKKDIIILVSFVAVIVLGLLFKKT